MMVQAMEGKRLSCADLAVADARRIDFVMPPKRTRSWKQSTVLARQADCLGELLAGVGGSAPVAQRPFSKGFTFRQGCKLAMRAGLKLVLPSLRGA